MCRVEFILLEYNFTLNLCRVFFEKYGFKFWNGNKKYRKKHLGNKNQFIMNIRGALISTLH